MTAATGLRRYEHIGRVYDLISLERLLYARPRRRLLSMIGPIPGASVVDVGCGTGLNFAGLHELVGPSGRIVGIDSSPSMLAAAQRRIQHERWANVVAVHGDVHELTAAIEATGLRVDDVDVLIATFVISTLHDDIAFWHGVDRLCRQRQRLIAVADLAIPTSTGNLRTLALRALATLGGSRPTCRPWDQLAAHSSDSTVESHLGGHVRLAIGRCDSKSHE